MDNPTGCVGGPLQFLAGVVATRFQATSNLLFKDGGRHFGRLNNWRRGKDLTERARSQKISLFVRVSADAPL